MVVIFAVNNDLFSNPNIILLLRRLKFENLEIVLCLNNKQIFPPPPDLADIVIFEISFFFNIRSIFRFNKNDFIESFGFINRAFDKPAKIIAIDPDGLIQSTFWKLLIFKNVETFFWSFEIVFVDELVTISSKIKKIFEIISSKFIKYLIVQDRVRLNLLMNANKFPDTITSFLIPVSPLQCFKKNVYSNSVTLLYSGSIEFWTGIPQLLMKIKNSEISNIKIHIHSRSKLNKNSELFKLINYLCEKNLINYSDDYFDDTREYMDFISKFDIGLVYYNPYYFGGGLGKNIENIGLSSGKFSTYIATGTPVIVSTDVTYLKLRNKYKYGEIIKDFKELKNAIDQIVNNFDEYRIGVVDLFNYELDPSVKMNSLIDCLKIKAF